MLTLILSLDKSLFVHEINNNKIIKKGLYFKPLFCIKNI